LRKACESALGWLVQAEAADSGTAEVAPHCFSGEEAS